jgi:hypothetical protein
MVAAVDLAAPLFLGTTAFHGLTPETETSSFYFWSAANGSVCRATIRVRPDDRTVASRDEAANAGACRPYEEGQIARAKRYVARDATPRHVL